MNPSSSHELGFPNAQRVAQPAANAYAIQIHPEQQRLNQYIMAELAKVKKDNKRLNDELLALRMENMSLSSKLDNRLNQTPQYGYPVQYPQASGGNEMFTASGNFNTLSKPQQELPFVEFDMRRQPPTVQSANVMFCSLLGYDTEEVLGKPWHNFIQDEYVERTIRQLQRDSGVKQMQFGQVYKDRNGRPVPCQDLHTFNRDEKGRVITDYVIVRPEGTAAVTSGTPLAMFAGMPQPAISAKRPVPSIMGVGVDDAELGTSPLQMMDESADGFTPEPPPMLGVSGEWGAQGLPEGLWDMEPGPADL